MRTYLIDLNHLLSLYNNGKLNYFMGEIRNRPSENRKLMVDDAVIDVDKVIKNKMGPMGVITPQEGEKE